MNVILYARDSSDRQAEKGLSIPAQLRELHTYCDRGGHFVRKEFVDDGWSGTTDQRPGFQAMVDYARRHKDELDAVLVWKQNRFSCDRIHAAVYKKHLRELGVDVVSITEPSVDSIDGEILEAVVEAADSRFSKSPAQDVMRGMREVAMRGFFPFSTPPYGYRKAEVEDGRGRRYRLAPDVGTEPVVVRMFCLYTREGLGAKAVAERLNEDGVTTGSGKPWTTQAVLRILENPVYIGTLQMSFTTKNARYLPEEDRSVELKNAHPSLVSAATFAQAQTLRRERARTHPRELGSDYLLSGLLRCMNCGSRLYGVAAKSSRHHYYTCKRFYSAGKSECGFGFVNRDRLDRAVVENVKSVLLEDTYLERLADEVNRELGDRAQVMRREKTALEAQLREKTRQAERLVDAIEKGEMPFATIRTRLKSRQEEIEKLRATLDELDEGEGGNRSMKLDIERIRPYVEDLRETLSTAPVKTQRAALKSFIREIRVAKDAIEIEFAIPQPSETPAPRSPLYAGVLDTVTSGTPGGTCNPGRPEESHRPSDSGCPLDSSGVRRSRGCELQEIKGGSRQKASEGPCGPLARFTPGGTCNPGRPKRTAVLRTAEEFAVREAANSRRSEAAQDANVRERPDQASFWPLSHVYARRDL